MISNTRSGEGNLAPDAVGRGARLHKRPDECPPTPFVCDSPLSAANRAVTCPPVVTAQPYCRAILSPEIPRTAERRAAPHPQRAAHPDRSARGVAPAPLLGLAPHRDTDARIAEGIGAAARGAGPALAFVGDLPVFHAEDIAL
jgi:hypothetical protein